MTSSENDLLYFNGVDGGTGQYSLPPQPMLAFAKQITADMAALQSLTQPLPPPFEAASFDVDSVGWGVLWGPSIADEVQVALQPLLDLRHAVAGERFVSVTDYQPTESVADFTARHPDLPYYLLIVAHPTEISYQVEQQLGARHAVGRIYFDTPEEYAQYAQSLVALQDEAVKLPAQATFFSPTNLTDPLLDPLTDPHLKAISKRLSKIEGAWQVQHITDTQAAKENLSDLLGGADTPTLLVASGHGVTMAADSTAMGAVGALVCQDWPGLQNWQTSLPTDFYFAHNDLTREANLFGLLLVHLGSFGLGVPTADPLADASPARRRPLVAALPQRLLSHPRGGAVAMVGHVGLAWSSSQPALVATYLTDLLTQLLQRESVGRAVAQVKQQLVTAQVVESTFGAVLTEFEQVQSKRPDLVDKYLARKGMELVTPWLAYQTAQTLAVFGDPAVQMPVTSLEVATLQRPDLHRVSNEALVMDDMAFVIEPADEPAAEFAAEAPPSTVAPPKQAEKSGVSPSAKPKEEVSLLTFNGVNGATGKYSVRPMSETEFAESLVGFNIDKEMPDYGTVGVADHSDLAQTGWGVIFAQDDPQVAAIQEALAPLLRLRQEQTSQPYSEKPRKDAANYFKIFAGGQGYQAGDTKRTFLERLGVGSGAVDPENGVPYYLLIVGSPTLIPFAFQVQLDVQFGVGRIHFETVEEYAIYAQTVVAAERGEIKRARQAAFFGVENADDRATQMSRQHLVQPLYEALRGEHPDWQVARFFKTEANKAQLTRLLGGADTPALLFTASHGMEFPNGDVRQLPHQGALLCQDWPGPQQWHQPVPQDFYFAADDVTTQETHVAGLVSFHFACFGGGCPQLDQYSRQTGRRHPLAPYPFVAQLPTRLLAHPNGGALAVIAHVERAWGYSFLTGTTGPNLTVFQGALGALLQGDTVSYAMELFNERFAEIATEVTAEVDQLHYLKQRAQEGDSGPLQAHLAKHGSLLTRLWTEHNDARDYIILGDPAVRLAVAAEGETPMAQPTINLQTTLPSTTLPTTIEPPSAEYDAGQAFVLGWGRDNEATDREPVIDEAQQNRSNRLIDSMQNMLEQLNNQVLEVVDDLTTLEVLTYGSEDLTPTKKDYEVSRKEQGKEAELSKVQLRAMTRIKLDGDIINVVPKTGGRSTQVDKELWDTHLEMVKLGQAQRIEFVKAVGEIAGTVVKALKS